MRILSKIRVNADRIGEVFEDVAGAVTIFAIIGAGLWIACGLGLVDGGDQVVGVR